MVGHHMKMIGEGIYQLGALGRNLNQQLRLVHIGQVVGPPPDVASHHPARRCNDCPNATTGNRFPWNLQRLKGAAVSRNA